MDRQIIYPGQLLPETTLLQMTKDSMIGAAKLASALLGTSTMASGFAVTPTGPASLQVLCAPGEIYSLATIDALAFSTLPADTTHSILKQGILLDGVTLSCPAPGTTGQSINYLVQVTYQDSDATPVLLPYYNSANPALPYSGMGNNGLTQNTVRKGSAVVAVKAGASATTGSQVTPSPDAGYIGLYVVTVAFGQTTIIAGNIAAAANAPIINSTLHGLSPVFSVSPVVPVAASATQAVQFGQVSGVVGQTRNLKMSVATASATATLTADEIIVETALSGLRYCLASFSKTINLATTGAGGMDTGTAPVSGFVGIYAIYNVSTGVSALLATNATAAAAPEVYGGANMPSGYTASALVGVWPTNGSSLFIVGEQKDRYFFSSPVTVLTTSTQQVTLVSLSISTAVPRNAKSFRCNSSNVSSTTPSNLSSLISGASVAIGQVSMSLTSSAVNGGIAVPSPDIPIITMQTTFYACTASAGTMTYTISINGYSF